MQIIDALTGPCERGPARWAAVGAAVVLLGSMTWEIRARDRRMDSRAHHAQFRALVATAVPYSFGDWLGRDGETPQAAAQMLHANALVNRAYTNVKTGETASLLLVQCSDARDLVGHYPPICYKGRGKLLTSAVEREWVVSGERIRGMRYRFGDADLARGSQFVVDNFMILPTGAYGRDMDSVNAVAQDTRWRHFGVAQVQVVTEAGLADGRRDEIFGALLDAILPLLRTARASTEEARER